MDSDRVETNQNGFLVDGYDDGRSYPLQQDHPKPAFVSFLVEGDGRQHRGSVDIRSRRRQTQAFDDGAQRRDWNV